MDRTKQVNLNYKIAVKLLGWQASKNNDRWLLSDGGFTGYYIKDGSVPSVRMIWDPCTIADHAIFLWKSKPFQDQAVWMQVYKPGVFRARVAMHRGQELFQKEQFYDIMRYHSGDRWVEVMEETAEMAITKAADVIMDIWNCTKLMEEGCK